MTRMPHLTLLAAGLLLTSAVRAQTTSKTEAITYYDNTTSWVLGQTLTVTDVGTGLVQSATTYDTTTALPLTTSSFGKLQSTMTYNTDGTLATVKDGLNKTTTLSNWKRGIPQAISFADGTSMSAMVNDNGWITSVTNEVGTKTCYGYDAMGRLASITYPSESSGGVCDTSKWAATSRSFVPVASTEYGIPAGHWRETTTTGNATKSVYYDGLWRPLLTHEYDAANMAGTERFSKRAYDTQGRAIFGSYPSNTSTSSAGVWTQYDALDRVTSTIQDSELGPLTTTATYNTGFTTTVTNPNGFSTSTSYLTYDQPATDWPLAITGPESATTTIVRDSFGKPISLTRSGGGVIPVVRSYSYNSYQELCRTVEPETGATLFGYDGAGNLTWSAAGLLSGQACSLTGTESAIVARKASRTYDVRNRLTSLGFLDNNGNQSFIYHADGLPSQVTTFNDGGASSVINAYTYNNRRMLTGESSSQPGWYTWAIGYGYNSLGTLSTQTYPTGLVVEYAPNALGQATQVVAPGTPFASGASYYPNGALKQFTYGNGIVHTMSQNARQLPAISSDTGTINLQFAYDANGNVAAITDAIRGATYNRTMAYDGLDRLLTATSPSFDGDGVHRFIYDALDNLKSWKLAGVRDYATYNYDNANRLTNIQNSAGDSIIGLGYDVQGNLSNRNGQAYSFDYGNRLRAVSGKEYYRYDGSGRRVLAWSPASANILSLYSNAGQLVYSHDERQGKGIDHVYFAGSLVATIDRVWATGVNTLKYQHTDALGSPVAVTNTSATVIDRTDWEPYGRAINKPTYQGVGYTGHVMDAASGLIYMQQRYYDPSIGRFLSVDPVTARQSGDNFNRYAYAFNNPYKFNDPDGRDGGNFYTDPNLRMAQPGPEGLGTVVGLIADFTPIIGDIKGIAEAAMDPTLTNIAAAGIGLIPVVGDVAGKVLKNSDTIVDAAKAVNKLPKPPTGPGAVARADRDPKRFFTPSERGAKRAEQGSQCGNGCGKKIDGSNSAGHHIERHADGGKTTSANHAEVCVDCHKKLHE